MRYLYKRSEDRIWSPELCEYYTWSMLVAFRLSADLEALRNNNPRVVQRITLR